MKVVELLKIGGEMLKVLSSNDIYVNDWQYVELYERFKMMRKLGIKHTEAIRMLAKEKHVGCRTLERAFKRLEKDC